MEDYALVYSKWIWKKMDIHESARACKALLTVMRLELSRRASFKKERCKQFFAAS